MNHSPRREPIRKPQTRNRHYSINRNRTIAQTINHRLVRLDGRISLIPELNDYRRVQKLLDSINDWNCVDAKSFLEHTGSSGDLNQNTLKQIVLAYDRWQQGLRKARQDSFAKRPSAEMLTIKRRIKFARDLLESGASQSGSGFLLAPDEDRAYQKQLKQLIWTCGKGDLPRSQYERARFVYWAGGARALERFITTLLELPTNHEEPLQKIQSCLVWLNSLRPRLNSVPDWVLAYEIKSHPPLKELVNWSERHLGNIRRKRGTSASLIDVHCEQLKKTRAEILSVRNRQIPNCLAAWSICARSGNRLPIVTILQNCEDLNIRIMKRRADWHVKHSHTPQYSKALQLINDERIDIANYALEKLCAWIERNERDSNILFCLKSIDLYELPKEIPLALVFSMANGMKDLLSHDDYELFNGLLPNLQTRRKLEVISICWRWIASFSDLQLNDKTKKLVESTLTGLARLMSLKEVELTLEKRVRQWSSRNLAFAECFPDEPTFPKQLRKWLRQLGYFQRLAISEIRVPKYLRQSLEKERKRASEQAYLERQIAEGTNDSSAVHRLQTLKRWKTDHEKTKRRHLRSIKESCLYAGLDALRQMFVGEATRIWKTTTQHPVHSKWSDKRIVEIAAWIKSMDPTLVASLRKILNAYRDNQAAYKECLAVNHEWIRKMMAKNIDLNPWMSPPECVTRIAGRELKISVTRDPYEVFMMGNYFGTCLSQGGCNQHSVIVNAMEANKQVIYVHDQDGKVVARQLIAIGKRDQLVRYYFYRAPSIWESKTDETEALQLDLAVTNYCCELARRIGIQLGIGSPQSLSQHYWYDDNSIHWTCSAKTYHRAELKFLPPKPARRSRGQVLPGTSVTFASASLPIENYNGVRS